MLRLPRRTVDQVWLWPRGLTNGAISGCSLVRQKRVTGGHENGGSNPLAPTVFGVSHCMHGVSKEARSATFNGDPCPKGHTLRLVRNRKCAVCKQASNHTDKVKEARLKWQRENPEVGRRAARKSMRKRAGVSKPTSESGHGQVCAICGLLLDESARGYDAPAYDHDHTTGEFRGWLCKRHNLGVAYFKDNPELFRKAADYLESFGRRDLPNPWSQDEPDGAVIETMGRAGNPQM
jgi:hypothetical protein